MPENTVAVASSAGLHARPVATLVETVSRLGVPMTIGRPGGPAVDAGSILSVLTLAVKHGEEVVVGAPAGPDGAEALRVVGELLETDLDAL